MKLTKIFSSVLIILLLASCKNEAKKEVKQDETKLPETVGVTFNVLVQKDDVFHLLYTEDSSLNFSDDKSIALRVKGSDQPQDIIFKMPVDVFPTNIRLDIGENKDQGEMAVNSIKGSYYTSSFEHKEPASFVKKWFYFNDFQLSCDEKTNNVKAVIGKDGRYVPLMWCNEVIRDEFIKLAKGK
jgi:hypothetical protein